jgi:hypothetical protein
MADRKVTVEVKIKLVIRIDEGTEVSQVIDEMDYRFNDTTGSATIEDTEILDQEVTDSK